VTVESTITPAAGRQLTTSYWAAEDGVALIEHTVGSLLRERAVSHAEVVAVIGTEHGSGNELRLTYAELYDRASRVASALVAITEPGDFVALWAPNVIEWPIVQYGAALAGVVLVALNPVLRASELTYALTHSRATVLIHADRSRDYAMADVVDQVRSSCPDLRSVVSLSERSRWQADVARPDALDRAPADPDRPVMLQYTSGTTGNPKGVLLRHRSLVNVAKLTLETVDVAPGSIAVNPLPMFHTAGCVISTLGPLWVGGTVVLIETFDPATVLARLREEQATVLFFVPAILAALLTAQAALAEPAPKLRTILGGASSIPASMIEAAEQTFGAIVINLFGQTELAPVLTATRPADSRQLQLTTVGRPLPRVDCAILDPDTGEVQPLGAVGEICARGYQQMVGYLHDPAATAGTVDADGFVHTGDLGSMNGDGYITLTGRLKDLIIRGGENISPAEIESCLINHPEIVEATVVGVPDEHWGEIVVAVLRLTDGAHPDLVERLVDHCRAHLSPHKLPVRWHSIDALPVTPTGKVQKFRVIELIESAQTTLLG